MQRCERGYLFLPPFPFGRPLLAGRPRRAFLGDRLGVALLPGPALLGRPTLAFLAALLAVARPASRLAVRLAMRLATPFATRLATLSTVAVGTTTRSSSPAGFAGGARAAFRLATQSTMGVNFSLMRAFSFSLFECEGLPSGTK